MSSIKMHRVVYWVAILLPVKAFPKHRFFIGPTLNNKALGGMLRRKCSTGCIQHSRGKVMTCFGTVYQVGKAKLMLTGNNIDLQLAI